MSRHEAPRPSDDAADRAHRPSRGRAALAAVALAGLLTACAGEGTTSAAPAPAPAAAADRAAGSTQQSPAAEQPTTPPTAETMSPEQQLADAEARAKAAYGEVTLVEARRSGVYADEKKGIRGAAIKLSLNAERNAAPGVSHDELPTATSTADVQIIEIDEKTAARAGGEPGVYLIVDEQAILDTQYKDPADEGGMLRIGISVGASALTADGSQRVTADRPVTDVYVHMAGQFGYQTEIGAPHDMSITTSVQPVE